jgi:hypothetical protein
LGVNKSALDRLWLQGTFKSKGQGRQRVNATVLLICVCVCVCVGGGVHERERDLNTILRGLKVGYMKQKKYNHGTLLREKDFSVFAKFFLNIS